MLHPFKRLAILLKALRVKTLSEGWYLQWSRSSFTSIKKILISRKPLKFSAAGRARASSCGSACSSMSCFSSWQSCWSWKWWQRRVATWWRPSRSNWSKTELLNSLCITCLSSLLGRNWLCTSGKNKSPIGSMNSTIRWSKLLRFDKSRRARFTRPTPSKYLNFSLPTSLSDRY